VKIQETIKGKMLMDIGSEKKNEAVHRKHRRNWLHRKNEFVFDLWP